MLSLNQSKRVLKGLDRLTKQQTEYKLILWFRDVRVNFEVIPLKFPVVTSTKVKLGQPGFKITAPLVLAVWLWVFNLSASVYVSVKWG